MPVARKENTNTKNKMPAAVSAPKKSTKESAGPSAPKRSRTSQLSIPAYTLSGAAAENIELPKEVFGVKINKNLVLQAVRVYRSNQQGHFSHTKTRGEVEGSTRKIFKQKGTGNARHGAVRAPIFVGGGIALGPRSRKTSLDLPKKMKKAALMSALSLRALEGEVLGIAGLDKATGKTKQVATLMNKLAKRSVLIIDGGKNEKAARAVKNLDNVGYSEADKLNALDIVNYQSILLSQTAVDKLVQFVKNKEGEGKP